MQIISTSLDASLNVHEFHSIHNTSSSTFDVIGDQLLKYYAFQRTSPGICILALESSRLRGTSSHDRSKSPPVDALTIASICVVDSSIQVLTMVNGCERAPQKVIPLGVSSVVKPRLLVCHLRPCCGCTSPASHSGTAVLFPRPILCYYRPLNTCCDDPPIPPNRLVVCSVIGNADSASSYGAFLVDVEYHMQLRA